MWLILAFVDALMAWSVIVLIVDKSYGLAAVVVMLLIFMDYALINPKGYPYRYMIMGVLILGVLTVYPIYYTFEIAFTNYATGYLWSKNQAIELLLSKVVIKPNAEFFDYSIYSHYNNYNPTDEFVILLRDKKGSLYISTQPVESGNTYISQFRKLIDGAVSINSVNYKVERSLKDPSHVIAISVNGKSYGYFYSPVDHKTLPNLRFFNTHYASTLGNTEFINPQIGTLFFTTRYGFSKIVTAQHEYSIEIRNVVEDGKSVMKPILIDTLTNRPVLEHDSAFWNVDPKSEKETKIIGYYKFIGFGNFKELLSDPQITKPFFSVFIWTFEWAALSVLLSFTVGLLLAIILNNKEMRFRYIYRTLLIIPWAIPAFITIIMWRTGFFNVSYGVINRIFLQQWLHLPPINWLGDPFWAKVALLTVNTWLGFPYMMVISLGALQSIPNELYEAASIDGSSRWNSFKKITFPLLMVPLAPLLVASFAFNFNNFNVIFLLTAGGPPIPNAITPAGATDILLSYTYKLAFQGASGRNYGLAAAVSILIFVIIASISAVNFKLSGSFEEVNR